MRIRIAILLLLALSPASSAQAKLRTVVIDPAAGGNTLGVQTRLFTEKDISLRLAKRIQSELTRKRIQVSLTRFDDYPLTAYQRIGIANQQKKTTWISLHFAKALTQSQINIYTLAPLPSKRKESSFLIPLKQAHRPWISRSELLASIIQETLPPWLAPKHIQSTIPIRSLLGVNHPGIMLEIMLDTQTMQPDAFENLLDELSERISIAIATFIKKERKL